LTGELQTPRYAHTATLLPNGKVLVAGGTGPTSCSTSPTATAELYDAASGTWSATGNLIAARSHHTATLLQDGQVLVAGGYDSKASLNSAELYDPATGTWRPTGSFNTILYAGSVTLLSNGTVLAVGASRDVEIIAELYDSATGTWSATGAPSFLPSGEHAVLLPDGKVLAVSEGSPWDYGELSAELYDPATGRWSSAGYVPMFWAPAVTLLRNGKVLVTGLFGANYPTQAALYDSDTGTWTVTGSLSTFRHSGGYTATTLANGQVLVAGGIDYITDRSVEAEETYDPATGAWARTNRLVNGRRSHTATLLRNGKVLVAGGLEGLWCDTPAVRSAELYDPGTGSRSTDGQTWTLRNSGLHVSTLGEIVVDPANPKLMYVATSGGIYKTTDGGIQWLRSCDLPHAVAVAIASSNPSVVFASSYESAMKTTDGGATWTKVQPNPTKLSGAKALAIDPSNPSTVYAVLITENARDDASGGLSKSINGGSTFSYINAGLPFSVFYYGFDSSALAIDPSVPSTLYASSIGISKSWNAGASWFPMNFALSVYVTALTVDPSQSNFVYAGTQQGVFRSSDGGNRWEQLQDGLPMLLVTDIVVDPSKSSNVYVSTEDKGVYKSSDRGQHWTAFSEGLPATPVYSLAIDSTGTFLAAATGKGVFTLSADDAITLPPSRRRGIRP
jgi:photosystem II stability/assembly factor-like uncharacterized protein/N-acetylneuraminic acid mutarotase